MRVRPPCDRPCYNHKAERVVHLITGRCFVCREMFGRKPARQCVRTECTRCNAQHGEECSRCEECFVQGSNVGGTTLRGNDNDFNGRLHFLPRCSSPSICAARPPPPPPVQPRATASLCPVLP